MTIHAAVPLPREGGELPPVARAQRLATVENELRVRLAAAMHGSVLAYVLLARTKATQRALPALPALPLFQPCHAEQPCCDTRLTPWTAV